MNKKTLKVKPAIFDELESLLKIGGLVDHAGRDEVLFCESVQFDDGCCMDIKVVNAETDAGGPWTEGVLFHAKSPGFSAVGEIGPTDVGDELAGEYRVGDYIVTVEREKTG